MDMPLHPTSIDIAIRLILTVLAGAAIGINREAGGHSAGFRTTVLVGVAAALSMVLANLLLSTGGKTPELFATMDPMRLPLGILTGMGFIGGGAILKQGTLISGVTTAATLWAMTVVGLCFGGGQLLLGVAGAALILFTLIGFRHIDARIPRQRRARVVITGAADTPPVEEIYETLPASGYRVKLLRETNGEGHHRLSTVEVLWDQPEIAGPPLALIKLLKGKYDVQSFEIVVEGTH